ERPRAYGTTVCLVPTDRRRLQRRTLQRRRLSELRLYQMTSTTRASLSSAFHGEMANHRFVRLTEAVIPLVSSDRTSATVKGSLCSGSSLRLPRAPLPPFFWRHPFRMQESARRPFGCRTSTCQQNC